MRLKTIILAIICLATLAATSWAIGIAGSAGGKRVTVAVDGTWQGTYAAGTTYAPGDIVTDGTTNYRSLQADNVGNTPASSPTYWQAILAKGDTGATGATGAQGATGPAGADGRTVLTTSGAPSSGTGANGDYAYDSATFLMYGPKTAGAWPSGVLLKGADGNGFSSGSDGTYGWYTGNNTSSYTDCTSGRYGLNFVGGELYVCKNGTNTLFTGGGTGLSKSDDFTARSNEDPLGHSQWTKTSWSAGTVWLYSGAVSGNGSTAPNAYYWSPDSFAANQCSAVTFKSLDGHSGAGVRLSSSGGYLAIIDPSGYEIKKYNSSGTETVVQSYVTHTISTSNTYKFCASSTTLTLYENTTSLWSTNDSSYSSGQPGIGITSVYGGQIATWAGTEL